MAPVTSKLSGVSGLCVGCVSGRAMMSSQRILPPQASIVTSVNVLCSHVEISSKKYLCSHVKCSLKLLDLNKIEMAR